MLNFKGVMCNIIPFFDVKKSKNIMKNFNRIYFVFYLCVRQNRLNFS